LRCLWRTPVVQSVENAGVNGLTGKDKSQYQECDMSVARTEEMWEHIVSTHLGIPKDPESGKFSLHPPDIVKSRETASDKDGDTAMADAQDTTANGTGAVDEAKQYSCHWSTCRHFPAGGVADAAAVARHVATHLPDASGRAAARRQHNRDPEHVDELLPQPLHRVRTYWNTATDEGGQGCGVPLAAVLVLRNLALQMGRVDRLAREVEINMAGFGGKRSDGGEGGGEGWVAKCFLPWRERLFEVWSLNLSLGGYMGTLVDRVDRAVENMSTNAVAGD